MSTTSLDQRARLQLAASAEAARIRTEAVRERNAPILARMEPFDAAMQAFRAQVGHDFDSGNRQDCARLAPILEAHGAGHLSWKDFEQAIAAGEECAAYDGRASDALHAVAAAWQRGDGETVLAWVGCSREELLAAIEAQLASDGAENS